MDTKFLTPAELSSRYRGEISERTLANWRSLKQGPSYIKAGGKVLYKLAAVLEWERTREFAAAVRRGASALTAAVLSVLAEACVL